jgi:glucosamine-6-phosphate deaminase
VNIFKFDSEDAWVEGVASFWRDRLRNNPRLRMCLPSGHTPNKIFAVMGEAVKARQVSFREAEVFCLDEYGGLAPEDPGRCANMLGHYLLQYIDLPRENFHRIDIDAPDLEKVCRDYDASIEPGFDLTLLGLGLNGHLGMNEPGSRADSPTRKVSLAASTVKSSAKYLTHGHLPTWGVSVGLRQLVGSGEVWLLANGAAKAEIIQRTVEGTIGEEVPATLLRQHGKSFLMVDAEAGKRL